MEPDAYRTIVAGLTIGKRLPEAVYLHREGLPLLPAPLLSLIRDIIDGVAVDRDAFDVVKLSTTAPRVSLLAYPAFFEVPFPALTRSWTVDVVTRAVKDRSYASCNAPILHRKETLLPADHPSVPLFTALTQEAERAGLFDGTSTIGYARHWAARLAAAGVVIEGHCLRRVTEAAVPKADGPILRHRTALHRFRLSTPMQALWRHGFLDGSNALFDYGCGHGDDLRALRERGIPCAGWDPFFAPNEPRAPSDIVNLGFVLNVVEDPTERRAALEQAFALARRVLVVAAILRGRPGVEKYARFGDGVVTGRSTFQKFYDQGELRDYVENCLGREPIALGPGVFFVFRDDAEEQRFLSERQSRRRPNAEMPTPSARPAQTRVERPRAPRAVRVSKWDAHREIIDEFWAACIALGRLPLDGEFARDSELRAGVGSPATVLRKLRDARGDGPLEAARLERMGEMLVYLALNLFERRRSLGALPPAVQRDVKAFWGSYLEAQQQASRLLFSTGDSQSIHAACVAAAAQGNGFLDGNHSLQLHTSLVARLPPVLRVYLGCATRLYGDIEGGDLVKIHIRSAKVSVMTFDDFAGRALPEMVERVKISLRAQSIDFFAYGGEHPSPLLYLKSRFLHPSFSSYDDQLAFDRALAAIGGVDLSGFGPDRVAFDDAVRRAGLVIDGFHLRSQNSDRT